MSLALEKQFVPTNHDERDLNEVYNAAIAAGKGYPAQGYPAGRTSLGEFYHLGRQVNVYRRSDWGPLLCGHVQPG